MSRPLAVELFVEDQAHEAFLVPILHRISKEEGAAVSPRVRSARGGHGRALNELALYQKLARKGAAGLTVPDLLIVGIDANCSTFAKAKKAIEETIRAPFSDRLVIACPDPHIERWYLDDPESFSTVVGYRPAIGRRKCVRDYYKDVLTRTIRQAGHLPTLGGIEFAQELAADMDFYRAGKNDRSLKVFLDDLRGRLRRHESATA